MLKKLSIALAVVAALGLSFATLSSSDAKPQQQQKNFTPKKNYQPKNYQNKNYQNKNFQNKNVQYKKNYVVGQKYNGHYWYGRNRHRWHGRWYDYGVGPCWINIDGLWFWNVAACPP